MNPNPKRGPVARRRSYADWIAGYLAAFEDPSRTLGRCRQAAEAMARSFPELEVVRGHVLCPAPWGRRGHWWAVSPEGDILDPTAGQFTLGIARYEPYVEGGDVRLGKCMECGTEIWGPPLGGIDSQFCDEACRHDFGRALNTQARAFKPRGPDLFEDEPAFGPDAPVAAPRGRR